MTSSVATSVLGQVDFSHKLVNQGGTASASTLAYPFGVSVDTAGHLWVSDATNNRALEYDLFAPPDSDGDGCPDADEPLLSPPTDPNDPWDFYSVPVPALLAAPDPLGLVRDSVVGAGDAQAVFAYFKAAAHTGTTDYEQDLSGTGTKDGIEYDRSVVGPGHSGSPDGTIAASDAQLAFAQFKLAYHC